MNQARLERWTHPYECDHCGDTYRTKKGLLRHWCRSTTRWFR